jgi:hypothetical protein
MQGLKFIRGYHLQAPEKKERAIKARLPKLRLTTSNASK